VRKHPLLYEQVAKRIANIIDIINEDNPTSILENVGEMQSIVLLPRKCFRYFQRWHWQL